MKTAIKSFLALSLILGTFMISPILTPNASAQTMSTKSYGVTYTTMNVGDSNVFMGGDRYEVLNGQNVLEINQYGMVRAIGLGKATVVVYKNGVIYWVHYVTVVR
ncbi:hypothetical protein [Bacillus sonorensis]|uniref:hypothetical protein n=1 Tax=Bacillus sonorensis TaxID=119858 RepID=UPI000495E922|nr:hypothetical protein [Bacillus sonorensis]MCY7855113.1 hypothetical protein [Bacillus sonorensis]MCY8024587.1 hypothetical protein [Bacillus sonorensis]MCY8090352.1 hypothetical protein [Bacillus sonorensis]MEC1590641.1 hypothetical protein [Bacillus sonorensis]